MDKEYLEKRKKPAGLIEETFSTEPGAPPPSGPMPVKLKVEEVKEKNNAWLLTLIDGSGEVIAQNELVKGSALDYLRKNGITKDAYTALKAGTYDLKSPFTLKGSLYASYAKMNEARQRDQELAAQSAARVVVDTSTDPASSQAEVMARLLELGKYVVYPATGHPAVKMIKIKIDKGFTLLVGGQQRPITHLYTQTVETREVRCYLGNAQGAYQRVHTSLTTGTPPTAHTMVQTGPEVAVPGWRGKGTRIGFDSAELDPAKGLRGRQLTNRPGKQSTAADNLIGQDWNQLTQDAQKGAVRMAENFNLLLDQVFKDIMKGPADKRDVTGITADFALLDDDWNFRDEVATPEEEWRRVLHT